eukprot:INCI8284.1.p1 GENE.INCI8284.1~~INCI8284.1.p1  ORF type:complete len:226 (-),score=41.97 INCI8284.1:630-1307(-)
MRVLNLLFAVSAFAGTVAGAPHLRRRLQTSDADVPIDPGNLDPANIDPSTLTGPVIPDVDPDSVGNLDGAFARFSPGSSGSCALVFMVAAAELAMVLHSLHANVLTFYRVFPGPATGPDDSSGPVENSDVGVDVGGGDSDFNGDTPDAPGPADPDQGSGDDSEPEDPPPPHGDQSGQVVRVCVLAAKDDSPRLCDCVAYQLRCAVLMIVDHVLMIWFPHFALCCF